MKSTNFISSKQTETIPPKNTPQSTENKKAEPGDIHKVVDGKVVPTRAPSQIEQDVPPGVTTKK